MFWLRLLSQQKFTLSTKCIVGLRSGCDFVSHAAHESKLLHLSQQQMSAPSVCFLMSADGAGAAQLHIRWFLVSTGHNHRVTVAWFVARYTYRSADIPYFIWCFFLSRCVLYCCRRLIMIHIRARFTDTKDTCWFIYSLPWLTIDLHKWIASWAGHDRQIDWAVLLWILLKTNIYLILINK